jgi:hypothetical protein
VRKVCEAVAEVMGVILRPLGDVVVLLPPLSITRAGAAPVGRCDARQALDEVVGAAARDSGASGADRREADSCGCDGHRHRRGQNHRQRGAAWLRGLKTGLAWCDPYKPIETGLTDGSLDSACDAHDWRLAVQVWKSRQTCAVCDFQDAGRSRSLLLRRKASGSTLGPLVAAMSSSFPARLHPHRGSGRVCWCRSRRAW